LRNRKITKFLAFFSVINKYADNCEDTMLHIIRDINDELTRLIKDDPVRPEIPLEQRVNDRAEIYVLADDHTGEPLAVTCVKFLAGIPETVDELAEAAVNTNTAVFYTIWSYAQGAGQRLIAQAQQQIRQEKAGVDTYVTLSPKTEMARRFHLKNGAEIYRENSETVNYLYR
jgi:hypothetical protein